MFLLFASIAVTGKTVRSGFDSALHHYRFLPDLGCSKFEIGYAIEFSLPTAVCLIAKKKPLWIVSGILGALATAEMIRVLYFMPL
jgi:hypothetical protein